MYLCWLLLCPSTCSTYCVREKNVVTKLRIESTTGVIYDRKIFSFTNDYYVIVYVLTPAEDHLNKANTFQPHHILMKLYEKTPIDVSIVKAMHLDQLKG